MMEEIPVYLFTGFLDAGKTKFIQETLEDARFNSGESTLCSCVRRGRRSMIPPPSPEKMSLLKPLRIQKS